MCSNSNLSLPGWDDMSRFVGHPEPCFSVDGRFESEMMQCSTRIIAGWAVGAGDSIQTPYPYGEPFFEQGRSPYVVLQIHYDNSDFSAS